MILTQDISKLPVAPPEAGGSMISIFEILTQQRKQIEELTSAMTDVRCEITAIKDLPPQERPQASGSVNRGQTQWETQRPQGQRHLDSYACAINQGLSGMPNAARNPSITKPRPKPQGRDRIKGTAKEDNSLIAGPTQITLQLTNVNPEKTIDDIKHYIANKDETVKPIEVRDASEEGWDTKRFLVTFQAKDFNKVLSNSFWPDRIYFRQWFTRGRGKKKEVPNTNS